MVLAGDPTTWIKRNLERWKRKGKPSRLNTTPSTGTYTTVSTTVTTTASEKQQKTDDSKLQAWSRGKAHAKDYPMLEHDKYYTEWITKMERQIKLDRWE